VGTFLARNAACLSVGEGNGVDGGG
jgi:hypothetical protein